MFQENIYFYIFLKKENIYFEYFNLTTIIIYFENKLVLEMEQEEFDPTLPVLYV